MDVDGQSADMQDSRAVSYQLGHSWPPDTTPGIVTVSGRLFHRGEDCPGYRQGVDQAVKQGRNLAVIERVTAAAARARGKAHAPNAGHSRPSEPTQCLRLHRVAIWPAQLQLDRRPLTVLLRTLCSFGGGGLRGPEPSSWNQWKGPLHWRPMPVEQSAPDWDDAAALALLKGLSQPYIPRDPGQPLVGHRPSENGRLRSAASASLGGRHNCRRGWLPFGQRAAKFTPGSCFRRRI